jgi:hypothetical protein
MDELQAHVTNAVKIFLKYDKNLLTIPAHEQAVSHRIAVYLEQMLRKTIFSKLSVDCEYNKHGSLKKTINFDLDYFRRFRPCGCYSCAITSQKPAAIKTLPEKEFRPDIIVHRRKEDTANIIVMETKMEKVCPFDMTKLKQVTSPLTAGGYGYRLGVFLCFPNGQPVYEWFQLSPQAEPK